MKNIILGAAMSLLFSANAFADPSVYTPPLELPSSYTELSDGSKIHSIQVGSGETVVFLHGLPASAYLWRKVLPLAGEHVHAIAPDLAGYGFSDAPTSGDLSLSASLAALTEYLNGIEAESFTLVVTDIGSVLGLNYAVKNPDRISGIVMSEAVFQAPEDFMAQIRPEHREFIMAAQDADFVRQITIDQPAIVSMSMQGNTVTTLSETTLANYNAPYMEQNADYMQKRGTLNAVFGPSGLQNFGMLAAENAAGLAKMDVPILLVRANPGYMVNQPAVDYAKANFENLTIGEIDNAGHFFAEDNPEDFTKVVLDWLKKN